MLGSGRSGTTYLPIGPSSINLSSLMPPGRRQSLGASFKVTIRRFNNPKYTLQKLRQKDKLWWKNHLVLLRKITVDCMSGRTQDSQTEMRRIIIDIKRFLFIMSHTLTGYVVGSVSGLSI
jgi:hypothetical protein